MLKGRSAAVLLKRTEGAITLLVSSRIDLSPVKFDRQSQASVVFVRLLLFIRPQSSFSSKPDRVEKNISGPRGEAAYLIEALCFPGVHGLSRA